MQVVWLTVSLDFQLIRQSRMSSNNTPYQQKTDTPNPIVSAVTTRAMTHRNAASTTSTIETTPPSPFTLSDEGNGVNIFSNESLRHDQQQDTGIAKILENIHMSLFDWEYSIHVGSLCRNLKRSDRLIPVPVVEEMRVRDVLTAYHNSLINGAHFGRDRTYHKICDRYH